MRLLGVDIPNEKRVEVALTYIFGIGPSLSRKTLHDTNVNPDTRVKDLSETEQVALRDYIQGNFQIEGDLRRDIQTNIRSKIETGSYQGMRHRKGLPVRGQRTKTNARTLKGPRIAVAGKKKTADKT